MGKIAFVFSGQGAQFPGMGKSLYEASPAARAVFDMAETVRPDTLRQCFEGPAEALNQTENTQPCLFCVDLAAAKALEEAGVRPDVLAGFSLGEAAALTYGDSFETMEAGFRLVCKRAQAMGMAAEKYPGAMAAVLRLSNDTVEALCRTFQQMYPVNYNAPGQLVVAGSADEMDLFCTRVTEAGGKALPLKVSGGFHSPFMKEAAELMKTELEQLEFNLPRLPVYANLTAYPYEGDPKTLLYMQTKSPVRWQETVENMAADGVETFIEVGAGKTLCGLIKKIIKGARVFSVQEAADIETVTAGLESSHRL